MNRIGLVLRMHVRDRNVWFFVPWAITLSSFLINVIISVLIGDKNDLVTGGLASFFIYMFVMGIIAVSQFFPFTLGLSIRRTDFFLGSAAMAALVSAATSILLLFFDYAETTLTDNWNAGMQFFNIPYIHDGAWYEQLIIHFVLVLHMFFLGFFIGVYYRRFRTLWTFVLFFGLSILSGLAFMLCFHYDWWDNVWNWLSVQTMFSLTLWSIPLVLLYAIAGYRLLRTASA